MIANDTPARSLQPLDEFIAGYNLNIDDMSLDQWKLVLMDILDNANYHSLSCALPERMLQTVQTTPLKYTEQVDLMRDVCLAFYTSL